MTKTLLALGASACALALATPAAAQQAATTPAPAPTPAAAAAPAATPLPTMNFGSWGFDPASLDKSVKPGNDFFAFANDTWLKANPLPPEFSRFGSFNLLAEKSTADIKGLIDGLVARDAATLSADEARIVSVYRALCGRLSVGKGLSEHLR